MTDPVVPGELVLVPSRPSPRVGVCRDLCLFAVLLAVGYATAVVTRRSRPAAAAAAVPLRAEPPARPYLVVSSADPGDSWGRLVLVSAAAPKAGVFVTSLSCERTHMAGGRGACLRQDPATSTVLPGDLRRHVHGSPSRAPDRRSESNPRVARRALGGRDGVRAWPLLRRGWLLDANDHRGHGDRPGACRPRAVRGGARRAPLQGARLQLLGRHLRAPTATRSTRRSRREASTTWSSAVSRRAMRGSYAPASSVRPCLRTGRTSRTSTV